MSSAATTFQPCLSGDLMYGMGLCSCRRSAFTPCRWSVLEVYFVQAISVCGFVSYSVCLSSAIWMWSLRRGRVCKGIAEERKCSLAGSQSWPSSCCASCRQSWPWYFTCNQPCSRKKSSDRSQSHWQVRGSTSSGTATINFRYF